MRLRSFSLNSLFLLVMILIFFIVIFNLFYDMDNLKKPTNALKEELLTFDTNIEDEDITEREQDVHKGVIRGKIKRESQTEITAINEDKYIAAPPSDSDRIDSLREPLESTAAAQISDNLAEKKKTASLDEFSNGVYYSIHFGSFRSLSEAEERIELLKSKGHAWWKKVVLEGKDVWYRVYIGKFKTDAEALTFGKALIFPGISDKICIYKLKSID